MNILMILANPFTHDPRVYNEAKSLVNAGHNVTVFAWDKKGKLPKNDIKNAINIVRSYNNKLINLIPYDFLKLHLWWRKGYKEILKLFEEKSFDVIHCHDLSTLPIGVKLKKKFGFKLIYDAHEIFWYMIADDVPKFVMTYTYHLEKKLCKRVDKIITVNKPVKYYFEKISNCSIKIVMNAKPFLYKDYSPPKNKIFTVLYLGGIDRTRNLLEITEAVNSLTNIKFVVGGKTHEINYCKKLKEKCNMSKNCEFIGRIPMDEVIPMTRKSDLVVHLATAKSEKTKWPINIDLPSRFGLPNKLFESMVAGRPIIVPKNTYEAEFVSKIENGIAVDVTVDNIKNVLNSLKDDKQLCEKLGKNAFKAAKDKYNWKKQEEILLKLYDNILEE